MLNTKKVLLPFCENSKAPTLAQNLLSGKTGLDKRKIYNIFIVLES